MRRLSASMRCLIAACLFAPTLPAWSAPPSYIPPARGSEGSVLSLTGTWSLALDPERIGEEQGWHGRPLTTDSILIPGTLDVAGKGPLNLDRRADRLTRVRDYSGPAWYQTRFELPGSWQGRRVLLAMERTKASTVWLDGRKVGSQKSLVAEQVFDLGCNIGQGSHLLTVRIDNSERPPVGDPHQLSDATQTNWNGILGYVELRARDVVWIERVRVVPDVTAKQAVVELEIGRDGSLPLQGGELEFVVRRWNVADADGIEARTLKARFAADQDICRVVLPLGEDAPLWSEHSPALHRLAIRLSATNAGDFREVDFGLREFKAEGTQFCINGRATFLRGKHDACVFPLTGHAPMEVGEWLRVMRIAKDWGINHYRFHSWCPPRAAFAAADMLGIYLQPELPLWGALSSPPAGSDADVEMRRAEGDATERTDYLLGEGQGLMRAYANHASFVMFALGNELSGERGAMRALLDEIAKLEDRVLLAEGANNFLWAPSLAPGDDFWITNQTAGHYKAGCYFPDGRDKAVRGSFAVHTKGHVNNRHPSSCFDYRSAIAEVPVPVIGHESGQYQVYPAFDEIVKYTGVLRAHNFELYRERLEQAGMLDQWRDFHRASGALAALCYREEIEAALRTPGMGGFQLLDLQDFPGQGTALVGMLDAFMDSKGLIEPAEWREFCAPIVPLLRMQKVDWTQAETFKGQVEVANYGPGPLGNALLEWRLVDDTGKTLEGGRLQAGVLAQGGLTRMGEIAFSLARFDKAVELTLILDLPSGAARNRHRFWVYPERQPMDVAPDVLVTRSLNRTAIRALESGRKVLLFADQQGLARSIPGAFQPDFWCYPMFRKYDPPGTLGLLVDEDHPALRQFPTRFHSDWQWHPIVRHGCAMVLDGTPKDFRPIIQVIDNFERNHKLALAFEARVGEGRLLACSGALFNQPDSPACRQLLSSLLAYAAGDDFQPGQELTLDELVAVLAPKPDELQPAVR